MTCCILVIMGFNLGMFTSLFLYAWLDERSDRFNPIEWKRELETTIARQPNINGGWA